jgi:hypothetical protein
VFGVPGGADPWGWRFEGHHLSRHATIAGDRVALMPFFQGAWPTRGRSGVKPLEREEWSARELVVSMNRALRSAAVFQPHAPTDHETSNIPIVAPLAPVGIAVGDLGRDQQALVAEIVRAYLGTLPAELAEAQIYRTIGPDLERIQFGWAGPVEPFQPHYYRLQGPSFVLEHDNSRNSGTHIHSVWRNFADDFGHDLVKDRPA